jgi:ribose 1,5-bisphosphate isomerase
MQKIRLIHQKIEELEVQGASAVAKAILLALKDYSSRINVKNKKTFLNQFKKASDLLLSARPTEPLSSNVVKFLFFELRKAKDATECTLTIRKSVNDILKTLEDSKKKISSFGVKLINNNDNIFTHCHSSAVEDILIKAKKSGKKFSVFNTETRPLFQGHITAKNLLKAGLNITMVTDASAGFLISRFSDRGLMMDKLIIGCDAILLDGSAVNKVGSFVTALAAHNEKEKVYIAGSLLKFHPKNWIKIEKRPAKEIWSSAPKNLKMINFAFDVIPAQYIEGIICEAGLIKPSQVAKKAKEIYPWL